MSLDKVAELDTLFSGFLEAVSDFVGAPFENAQFFFDLGQLIFQLSKTLILSLNLSILSRTLLSPSAIFSSVVFGPILFELVPLIAHVVDVFCKLSQVRPARS